MCCIFTLQSVVDVDKALNASNFHTSVSVGLEDGSAPKSKLTIYMDMDTTIF